MNNLIKYQVVVNAPRKRYVPYSKEYNTKEEAVKCLEKARSYMSLSVDGELLNYKIKIINH